LTTQTLPLMKTTLVFSLTLVCSIFSISSDALNAFSYSILFDENKSTLNIHDRLSFRKYLDSVSHTNEVVRIEVLGYCDGGEYKSFLLDITQKRSKFITKELKAVFKNQQLKSINWCVNSDEKTLTENELNSILEKTRRIDVVFNINTDPKRNIKQGDKFILNGILFQGDEAILLEESMPALQTLYKELIKHPQLVIQIQGHIYDTDFILTEGSTNEMTLSARRAKRIYDYLIFKGIDPIRLSYIGLEGQFPLHKGAKHDRRVEVEIVNI